MASPLYTPAIVAVVAVISPNTGIGEPFTLTVEPGSYLLEIVTEWGASGQVEGLEYLIENILPCNIASWAVQQSPPNSWQSGLGLSWLLPA